METGKQVLMVLFRNKILNLSHFKKQNNVQCVVKLKCKEISLTVIERESKPKINAKHHFKGLMFLSLFFMKLYVCVKNITNTTVLQKLSQFSHCDHFPL